MIFWTFFATTHTHELHVSFSDRVCVATILEGELTTSFCFRNPSICSLQSAYCPCQNSTSSCNSPIFLESHSEDTLVFPTAFPYLTCSLKFLFSRSGYLMVVLIFWVCCSKLSTSIRCRLASSLFSRLAFIVFVL